MESVEIIQRIAPLASLDLTGKRVLLRLDLDLTRRPDGEWDDQALTASLPTLQHLLKSGARVAVAGHFRQPQGRVEPEATLLPVAAQLARLLDREVIFSDDCVGDGVRRMIQELRPDTVLCLENLQFHRGELDGGAHFSRKLAENFEVYVGDAFGCLHLELASLCQVPRLIGCCAAGLALQRTLSGLQTLLAVARRSLVVVLGGSALGPRAAALENLLPRCRAVLVGGAAAYPLLQARGVELGVSAAEAPQVQQARRLLRLAEEQRVPVLLPQDHLAAAEGAAPALVEGPALPAGRKGLDIGPKTANLFAQEIARAGAVFWSGPLGRIERPEAAQGSSTVIRALAGSRAAAVLTGAGLCELARRQGEPPPSDTLLQQSEAALAFLEGRALPGLVALAEGNRKGKK